MKTTYYVMTGAARQECPRAVDVRNRLQQITNEIEPGSDLPEMIEVVAVFEAGEIIICKWLSKYGDLRHNTWHAWPQIITAWWEKLIRKINHELGRRYAEEYLHRAHIDAEAGGILQENDLISDGFYRGPLKTHPGYVSRAETPLVNQLELYSGAYGVGFRQHIPRYDTNNYHYVRYWLYDQGGDHHG